MRVLVVEDDNSLGLFLQKGLRLEGHDVHLVSDGDAALAYAETIPLDLVVLDLGLPRRDGTEVLAELWSNHAATSVIVLTGRSHVDDRVHCLNLGADDFLVKPFSFHELRARCRAVLRRRQGAADAVLRFGVVTMNRLDRSVGRDGVAVELTVKEFALLEHLVQKRGACSTRAELLTEVWQMRADTATNVVDVYINYLRRKLAAAHPLGAASDAVIETVRGEGYRLVAASSGRSSAVVDPEAAGRKPPMSVRMDAAAVMGAGA